MKELPRNQGDVVMPDPKTCGTCVFWDDLNDTRWEGKCNQLSAHTARKHKCRTWTSRAKLARPPCGGAEGKSK